MKKEKPNLYEERMNGSGDCNGINYIKGLDDMCIYHKMNNTHSVLELGVNDGVSTNLFAYYALNVTAVDLIKTSKFKTILEKNTNIKFYQGNIYDIVPNLTDYSFDFIYIDADHLKNSVLKDIEVCLPKLKSNGIICGHDYWKDDYSDYYVKAAVNEFFKDRKINTFEDSSWSISL